MKPALVMVSPHATPRTNLKFKIVLVTAPSHYLNSPGRTSLKNITVHPGPKLHMVLFILLSKLHYSSILTPYLPSTADISVAISGFGAVPWAYITRKS